jgi:hypothetical protein
MVEAKGIFKERRPLCSNVRWEIGKFNNRIAPSWWTPVSFPRLTKNCRCWATLIALRSTTDQNESWKSWGSKETVENTIIDGQSFCTGNVSFTLQEFGRLSSSTLDGFGPRGCLARLITILTLEERCNHVTLLAEWYRWWHILYLTNFWKESSANSHLRASFNTEYQIRRQTIIFSQTKAIFRENKES